MASEHQDFLSTRCPVSLFPVDFLNETSPENETRKEKLTLLSKIPSSVSTRVTAYLSFIRKLFRNNLMIFDLASTVACLINPFLTNNYFIKFM